MRIRVDFTDGFWHFDLFEMFAEGASIKRGGTMRLRKVYVLFNGQLEEAAVQGVYTSKKRAEFALEQLPEDVREGTHVDEWAVNTTPAEIRLPAGKQR